jgi:hypothetical protein
MLAIVKSPLFSFRSQHVARQIQAGFAAFKKGGDNYLAACPTSYTEGGGTHFAHSKDFKLSTW